MSFINLPPPRGVWTNRSINVSPVARPPHYHTRGVEVINIRFTIVSVLTHARSKGDMCTHVWWCCDERDANTIASNYGYTNHYL